MKVGRLRFISLVASGGLAGATGIVLASILGSGSPTAGIPYLLPAFAAVFLGATQLKNGRFNAGGTIIAVLLLGTGTGLGLANAPQWSSSMFVGVVLIAALAVTGIQRRTTVKHKVSTPDPPNLRTSRRKQHESSRPPTRRSQRRRTSAAEVEMLPRRAAKARESCTAVRSWPPVRRGVRRQRIDARRPIPPRRPASPPPSVVQKPRSARPIPVADPISKPIPAGKKLVFVSCGVEACAVQGPIIQEAASILGWTVEQVATDGTPEKVQGAIDSAIRDGADAVIINAADRDALAKQIAEAQKAGVEFVTCCSIAEAGNGLLYNTATDKQNGSIGDYLAAEVVADSDGKADALYVNISAFEILKAVGATFESKMKEYCPDCGVESIDIPATALGKDAPDRIVSYLRSHPDTNYIALSVSDALGSGLPAALKAAGLADKVKIVGQGAAARPTRTCATATSRRSSPAIGTRTTTRWSTPWPATGPAFRSSTPARRTG